MVGGAFELAVTGSKRDHYQVLHFALLVCWSVLTDLVIIGGTVATQPTLPVSLGFHRVLLAR